ncbi:MAG: hypothetical protein M3498_06045 [Deinococcota bacterium]|nr:hypothetical protein [Deinococcota bacterium]
MSAGAGTQPGTPAAGSEEARSEEALRLWLRMLGGVNLIEGWLGALLGALEPDFVHTLSRNLKELRGALKTATAEAS